MIPNKEDVMDTMRLYLEPLAAKAEVNERMRIYRLFNQVEDLFGEIDRLHYNETFLEEQATKLEKFYRKVCLSALTRHNGKLYHLVATEDNGISDEDIRYHNMMLRAEGWISSI